MSVPGSSAPMSLDVVPAAGPSAAWKAPSYERNSTTLPVLSTSAMPSAAGAVALPPFWMPFVGKVMTSTPRPLQAERAEPCASVPATATVLYIEPAGVTTFVTVSVTLLPL